MTFFSKQTSTKFFSKGVLIGGCMVFGYAAANDGVDTINTAPMFFLPATPGVSIYGMGGNGETAIGDLMAPVFGHPLNFTYIDPQIFYHSSEDEGSASVGLGQRWMTATSGIFGAYVFGDDNHSIDGNDYWFVSPGVERLGSVLDFSANLYIPVNTQRHEEGLKFADETGDFSQVTFTGHTQYDELVNTFESTGWGGDAQVGMRIPFRNSKVYAGAYYFNPKDNDSITGGLVRAEVPITNFISVIMSEAYDSQYHNTLKAGLTIAFGGRSTGYNFSGNLVERMVDPIQRNAIGVAGGAHNVQPIVQGVEDTNKVAIEKSNISFFVPGNAPTDGNGMVSGDGTYENPYQGMSQFNVDNANDQNNKNFYINSGVYNAMYSTWVNPDFIVLNHDMLYGRQDNFTKTASGALRPIINFSNGGFLVPGSDSSDGFHDLQLAGKDATGTAGIFIDHESGSNDVYVYMNDLLISHFGDGIDIYNTTNAATQVYIDNSKIINNSAGGVKQLSSGPNGGYGGGIAALNIGGGNVYLNVDDSTIADNANNFRVANWGGIGLFNNGVGSSNLIVDNANVANNDGGVATIAAGIALDNEGTGALTAQINDSAIAENTNGVAAFSNLYTPSTNSLNLTINNSNLSNNSLDGFILDNGVGTGNTTVKIKNSQIIGNGLNGIDVENIGNYGDLWLSVTSSTIKGNARDGINIINQDNTGDFNLSLKNVNLRDNGKDGLELLNQLNTGDTNVDLKYVKITNNGGSGININNLKNLGSFYLNVTNALISDNANSGINLSSTNNPGNTIMDISHANIYGNNFGVNVLSNNSVGGNLSPTNVTVNIDQSKISNNNIGISLTSTATTGSNPTSNLTANISNSIIGRNLVAGISANSLAVAAGNKPTANTTVNVSNSLIIGNAVGVLANSTATGIGTPVATTTVNISKSAIVLNGVGVSVSSLKSSAGQPSTNVTIDQSVVAGNLVALSAAGNGVSNISVINPILFSGVVQFSGNGAINFPAGTPPFSSGDRVVCTPAGCSVSP